MCLTAKSTCCCVDRKVIHDIYSDLHNRTQQCMSYFQVYAATSVGNPTRGFLNASIVCLSQKVISRN
jgi:hypothetical protein